jgi:hypothetical protein
MSKRKSKTAGRTAPKKTARQAPTRATKRATRRAPGPAPKQSASKARPAAQLAGPVSSGRTLTVTIFLFRTGNDTKIRTSPQRLYANPGDHVEWNVVNLIDGADVPVTISWPATGPWGKEPIQIRGWHRQPFGESSGRFKYVVSALDAQEDPEIEIPEGN